MPEKRPRQGFYRNWVTYCGALLAIIGLVLMAMAVAFTFSIRKPSPYADIITFVAFPSVIVAGLVLVLGGMWRESRRRRRMKTTEALPFPSVDLNLPRHRRIFAMLVGASSVFVVVFAFAGYNAFLLTESVGFCGRTCHTQMGPEMTAYERSPHAKVPCVSCHVGEGAGHYVASKLNGMKQLYGVVFNAYERPIPTPIKGLRPARETCEECHWADKSWGSQLYQRPHFRYDEKSTPEQISMLLKTGGGRGPYGAGIHSHMEIDNVVTFVSDDEHLQSIPWVSVKRPDGSTTEYARTEKPLDPSKLSSLPRRTMDCIDCHNRPAHRFETPDAAVDRALSAGTIPPTLPWAKSLSVDTLAKEYPTRQAAHEGMARDVLAFYSERYPDLPAARPDDLAQMTATLTEIYDVNVFPEMQVGWKTYLSNLGHRNSPGCFRCHDGKHVAKDGRVLASGCDVCHTTPQRGPRSPLGEQVAAVAEKDWHPWQTPEKHLAVEKHKEIQCYECHVAGRRPKTECNECHGH